MRQWCDGYSVIAPFQENPADFEKGYCTIYPITSDTEARRGYTAEKQTETYWQVARLTCQISLYRFVKYDRRSAGDVARQLRTMLSSAYAAQLLSEYGINSGFAGKVDIDFSRDSERNRYIEHAHFPQSFYILEDYTDTPVLFDKIKIEKIGILNDKNSVIIND